MEGRWNWKKKILLWELTGDWKWLSVHGDGSWWKTGTLSHVCRRVSLLVQLSSWWCRVIMSSFDNENETVQKPRMIMSHDMTTAYVDYSGVGKKEETPLSIHPSWGLQINTNSGITSPHLTNEESAPFFLAFTSSYMPLAIECMTLTMHLVVQHESCTAEIQSGLTMYCTTYMLHNFWRI